MFDLSGLKTHPVPWLTEAMVFSLKNFSKGRLSLTCCPMAFSSKMKLPLLWELSTALSNDILVVPRSS